MSYHYIYSASYWQSMNSQKIKFCLSLHDNLAIDYIQLKKKNSIRPASRKN